MSRPFTPRTPPGPTVRVNGKIRAREVRVIGVDGRQLGILTLPDAINQARALGVDLVEVAPNAVPPVCRLVDFGKYRYEQAKKDKESKKHQHANKVKEVQLSASIDPHDFQVKLGHAIDFLCEEIKVKISLRFRGRELIHKEIGFEQVGKFIEALVPYAHPDSEPKLIGKGITVMMSPLPRNKRAKNPNQPDTGLVPEKVADSQAASRPEGVSKSQSRPTPSGAPQPANHQPADSFVNNPFSQLNLASE